MEGGVWGGVAKEHEDREEKGVLHVCLLPLCGAAYPCNVTLPLRVLMAAIGPVLPVLVL